MSNKTVEEVETEFKKQRKNYLEAANSTMYLFLREYFEARLEINRDRLELFNPSAGRDDIIAVQAEQKVMRQFITDIEEMRELANLESIIDESSGTTEEG